MNTQRTVTQRAGKLTLAFTTVTAERSRWCKLAKLVADHVFGHQDFDVLPPVVDHECDVDELRHNCAGSRPSFDRFVAAGFGCLLNLEINLGIDKRPLFAASTHNFRRGLLVEF